MTLITNQMIWEKLESLENIFRFGSDRKLKEELQEFTLAETSKLLGISSETLRAKVLNKDIECFVEERSNAIDGVTYKFTAKHIRDYQERRKYSANNEALTSAEIDKIIDQSFT